MPRIGRFSDWFVGGLGHCQRCLTNWAFVDNHATPYSPSRGCFPLCESCWRELEPAGRLPFYRQLWQSWEDETPGYANWDDIEKSVLDGK